MYTQHRSGQDPEGGVKTSPDTLISLADQIYPFSAPHKNQATTPEVLAKGSYRTGSEVEKGS